MFDTNKIDRPIGMFVFDIYIASLKIKEVVKDFDNIQDLLYDFRSWDTIIREFEIIGEASKYLLRDKLIEKEYQIVVDFRNYIAHEYFGIDKDRIWNLIHKDLNDFIKIILELIKNIEPKTKQELIEAFIEDNHYLDFVVKELKKL